MEESLISENESQSSLVNPSNKAYQHDLFFQLQEVISSLETYVFSWRNLPSNRTREESVTSPPELYMDKKPDIIHGFNQILVDDAKVLQSEITCFQENNAALRVKLRLTDKELDRSKATLNVFEEEKEKLQTKNLPGYQTSIPYPGIQPSNMESEMKWLKGHLDHVKQWNEQLSVTLQKCKTDSEKLSMHLGKQESACTALRLALQSSERCLKTYSVLLALAEAKHEIMLRQATSGDILNAGWRLLPKDMEIKTKLFLMEIKKIFRREGKIPNLETRKVTEQKVNNPYNPWLSEEEEQMLKDYIQLLKCDLSSITMSDHFIIGTSHAKEVTQCAETIKVKVDDAIRDSTGTLPCLPEKPVRTQIMQDLLYTKKKLSELKASLQLLQTEKRALELQSLTQQEQEKAYMLLEDHLQMEQNEWTKEGSGQNKAGKQKFLDGNGGCVGESKKSTSSASVQQLLDSLKTSSEMKVRIEGLLSEVEQLSCKVSAENTKSALMIKDFFKAHRNLFLTYQNACRKYQEQQHKLESQIDLMSHQQQRQLQKLGQNIQNLQEKKIQKNKGETSL
ncbi:colorectal mutant cancer protein-like isoform X4 [Eleutherodactylus coqui]|uniref:colorectal mutant cancer protein-like isoform X4 n=1 Tax=Eleutherodactylus coqui TaxID=57060 RepID=UPI0034623C41